jgi:hypothetical protein
MEGLEHSQYEKIERDHYVCEVCKEPRVFGITIEHEVVSGKRALLRCYKCTDRYRAFNHTWHVCVGTVRGWIGEPCPLPARF